ncbi:hypothetical protein OF83DRAFT_1066790 [Amylostereum chailletii]|nr:hypothetical protein OF83DRAFT_1066790 [Amylostereum chailletii]
MSGGFSSGSSSQLGGRSQAQQQRRQDPTPTTPHDTRPTPDPTGAPSDSTTVHITSTSDFSLLLPSRQDGMSLHASVTRDGLSYCSPSSSEPHCQNKMQDGFIVAAAMQTADDGSYIQITGCLNPANSLLDASDHGGQLDVRFPNGAQCTFGGYGASFIELVEPALNRFCIRCCASANDQTNCNSHQDRLGCETAIPGTYDFPDVGVSCS